MGNYSRLSVLFALLLVIIGSLIVVAVFFPPFSPGYPNVGMRMKSVMRDIRDQYLMLGLAPPTTAEVYLSSVLGSQTRILRGDVKTWTGVARGFKLQSRVGARMVVITTTVNVQTGNIFTGRKTRLLQEQSAFPRQSACQTWRLLGAVTAGTKYWKSYLRTGAAWGSLERVPAIPVVRPRTQRELMLYREWLIKMAGSWARFRDGWGHEIRLSLGNGSSGPDIIASSAGPDGKWGTRDDMMVERDIQTGKVIKENKPQDDCTGALRT